MVGGSTVLIASDLEREEEIRVEDESSSFDRLKFCFLRSLWAWASLIPDVNFFLVRCINFIL